jgi:hypothetical protein
MMSLIIHSGFQLFRTGPLALSVATKDDIPEQSSLSSFWPGRKAQY